MKETDRAIDELGMKGILFFLGWEDTRLRIEGNPAPLLDRCYFECLLS